MAFYKFNLLFQKPKFYCFICNSLIHDRIDHEGHSLRAVTESDLQYPTQILQPNDHDKTGAQYFFSESTVQTIVDILKDLKCK